MMDTDTYSKVYSFLLLVRYYNRQIPLRLILAEDSTVDLFFKRPGAGKFWGIKKKLELLIFLIKIIYR